MAGSPTNFLFRVRHHNPKTEKGEMVMSEKSQVGGGGRDGRSLRKRRPKRDTPVAGVQNATREEENSSGKRKPHTQLIRNGIRIVFLAVRQYLERESKGKLASLPHGPRGHEAKTGDPKNNWDSKRKRNALPSKRGKRTGVHSNA